MFGDSGCRIQSVNWRGGEYLGMGRGRGPALPAGGHWFDPFDPQIHFLVFHYRNGHHFCFSH